MNNNIALVEENYLLENICHSNGIEVCLLREFLANILKYDQYNLPRDRRSIDNDEINKEVEIIIIHLLQRNFCLTDIYIIMLLGYSHYKRHCITKTIYKYKDFNFKGSDSEKKEALSIVSKLTIGKAEIIPGFDSYGEDTAHNANTTQVVSIIGTYSISEAIEKFGNYIISGEIIDRKEAWEDNWSDFYLEDERPAWTEIELFVEDGIRQHSEKWVLGLGVLLILYLRKISETKVAIYQFLEIEGI